MMTSRSREPCISRRTSWKKDISAIRSVHAPVWRRIPPIRNAKHRRFDGESTQSPCGRRCHSISRDGPVNSNTINITIGVMKSEMMNVPKNPMRRWLPHTAVSRQNTTIKQNSYRYDHYAISLVMVSCLSRSPPEPDHRRRRDGPASHQAPVVAGLLLDGLRAAGAVGCAGGRHGSGSKAHLSFWVLMNSR